jgi:hypothetical protein
MFVVFSQIFSIVLAGVAISKSYVDFRARRESVQMFLLWTVTWIGIVAVALFPAIVDSLIAIGGGRVGIGTFLGMALVFLFFLMYRMYVRLERTEQKLTLVVQDLALKANWRDTNEPDERRP